MERKKGGDDKRLDRGAQEPAEKNVDQSDVEEMKDQVGQVVPAGVCHAKDRFVEHEREDGQGMPMARDAVGEGPLDAREVEPLDDGGILGDVGGIIEIDKFKADHLEIDEDGDADQAGQKEPFLGWTGLRHGDLSLYIVRGQGIN